LGNPEQAMKLSAGVSGASSRSTQSIHRRVWCDLSPDGFGTHVFDTPVPLESSLKNAVRRTLRAHQ
jgi:hypothetical protein